MLGDAHHEVDYENVQNLQENPEKKTKIEHFSKFPRLKHSQQAAVDGIKMSFSAKGNSFCKLEYSLCGEEEKDEER